MGNKQVKQKKHVHFAHVPIDRYEQLITRFRLIQTCVAQIREQPDNINLRNKFAVMAVQYLERGHKDIHVTQEVSHLKRIEQLLALIEELCPQQDNITEEQAAARSLMLFESVIE